MKFIFEESDEIIQIKEELVRVQGALLQGALPVQSQEVIPAETDLAELAKADGFYLLREGMLSVISNQRELFFYEEGDLLFNAQGRASTIRICSDFATKCDYYSISSFGRNPDSMKYLYQLMLLQQEMMISLVKHLHRGEKRAEPTVHSIRAGEHIVQEGVVSDRVYTLLEGHAEVTSGGEVVGEINADEIVGVIGAICGIPRIATVTATKDSLVMSLGKEDFIDLLSLRPQTIIRLIENFARIISASNKDIKEFRGKTKEAHL